jgi:hypothetical protein
MKTVITTLEKFKSVGKLRYSPTINGTLNRRDGGTNKWWLVIDVDPEIGIYYRNLFKMSTYGVKTLQRPAWDAHISVVSNEIPPNKENWMKYNDMEIEFEYFPEMKDNQIYFWFPVVCDFALDIRQELGLERNPIYPLHLTVGNSKEIQ